jgi:hypothetical protein
MGLEENKKQCGGAALPFFDPLSWLGEMNEVNLSDS